PDRRVVVGRAFEHPGVVEGDLRAAEDHERFGPAGLHFTRDPQGAIDVPEVASEAQEPRLPRNDLLDERLIAEAVGVIRGQDVDGIVAIQPTALRHELQVARGQGHVAPDWLGAGRRNRKLDEEYVASRWHGSPSSGENSP